MENAYILKSERLGLRNWKEQDLAPFVEMNLDKEVRRYFPSLATPEQSESAIDWFAKHIKEYGFGFFAVDVLEFNEFIGFIGLNYTNLEMPFTPCVEIGWRLKKEAWGKGYATEGAKVCLEFGHQVFGIEKIYSFTAIKNLPSKRVMEKIGMTFRGTFEHPKIESSHPLSTHVLYLSEKGETKI